MAQCRGIVDEIEKISKLIDFKVSKVNSNLIAENVESFLIKILEESAEISKEDKRKTVTVEDIKKVVFDKKLEVLKDLFV
jgi:histone H3/H4